MSLPRLNIQPARLALKKPVLVVVVDTEEEFDWSKPFDRNSRGTVSVPAQDRAHAVFDRYGIVPTYVMNHPVATSPAAARYFRGLVDQGRAHVGTHCHPWVTPPHVEAVSLLNSFHGNLPPELEAAKIEATTDAIAQAFGSSPRIFKAGRYGVGPHTFEVLKRLGYTVDCSFVPCTSYAAEGGPNFHGTPSAPFFIDAEHSLLEVPLTSGCSGALAAVGEHIPSVFDGTLARAFRLPAMLSRAGLLERSRLSPEGFDASAQIRLLDAQVRQGVKVFTLSYHSPSLEPGFTPYVRNAADLSQFLERLDQVFRHFRDRLGGEFSTLTDIEQHARGAVPA